MNDIDATTPTETPGAPVRATRPNGAAPEAKGGASAVPGFMLKAADTQVARAAAVLRGAADTIEDLVGKEGTEVPETIRTFAANAVDTLRRYGDRADETEAAAMIEKLQRSAAAHPLTTAGIGAALGAALGYALTRLGQPESATPEAEDITATG